MQQVMANDCQTVKDIPRYFRESCSGEYPLGCHRELAARMRRGNRQGRGSRIRMALNGVRAVFHRPHPQKETDKGAVVSMRHFLTEAGVEL
jgi:HicA-like toxin of HicAB toxin-antitoxin system